MNFTAALLLSLIGAVPVEATTLDGATITGALSALSLQTASVDVEGEAHSLPVANLHELRLHKESPARPPEHEIRLHDGSRISVGDVEVSSRSAKVVTPVFGTFDLPRTSVASIRLSKIDGKVEPAWRELLQRDSRDDLVVIRKGDALDHIEGVVSGIDKEAVRLLLEGSPVPIPRERIFGVILAAAEAPGRTIIGQLDSTSGDRLSIAAISLNNDRFTTQLAAGPSVEIAADDVAKIDFSLGKILYLVDIEPTQVTYPTDHELFLLDVWKYRKGTDSHSDPLRVGRQVYERGLWIHSGTTLTYRLNREFRRLRAVAGIAGGIGESCQPTVGLIVRGDGRELLNVSIAREDDVREVDLDVSGVRELEISVTSTDPDGVCEHLGLGDARVIK